MRNIKDEGIEWLEKEDQLAQKLLKTSGLLLLNKSKTTSIVTANTETLSSSSTHKETTVDELTKRKLERFLKGSKK